MFESIYLIYQPVMPWQTPNIREGGKKSKWVFYFLVLYLEAEKMGSTHFSIFYIS